MSQHDQNKSALDFSSIPLQEKIYLALPCYGGQVYTGFLRGLLGALPMDLIGQIDFIENDSLVSRARNTLAARFLNGAPMPGVGHVKMNWLMFIDVDLHWSPEQMAKIYVDAVTKGLKLVCGLYAMKKTVPQFVLNTLGNVAPEPGTSLVKVRESGTGFMLIHRSVFEEMAARLPDIAFETDDSEGPTQTRHDFFAVGPYRYPDGRRRYLSEDWMFCQRWRDLGGDVYVDTKVQIKHEGRAVYPLPADEIFQAARQYRRLGAPGCPDELV